jgi:hypothetical protein
MAASAVAAPVAKAAPVGPLWHELTAQQRQILTPVASEWNGFSGPKKQRLLNVAKRYPDMSPAEQLKIQARLPHWTELPQTTRDEARNNMKKLLQLPPDERKRTEEKVWLLLRLRKVRQIWQIRLLQGLRQFCIRKLWQL